MKGISVVFTDSYEQRYHIVASEVFIFHLQRTVNKLILLGCFTKTHAMR